MLKNDRVVELGMSVPVKYWKKQKEIEFYIMNYISLLRVITSDDRSFVLLILYIYILTLTLLLTVGMRKLWQE